MQVKNVKVLAFGCRLNTLEAEKLSAMLANAPENTFIVNTCSVTAEAERQCKQAIRKLARENPDANIFITGCAATRGPDEYAALPGVRGVVSNKDKLNPSAYGMVGTEPCVPVSTELSKQFIQIQNGCNHSCTYCIVHRLRGLSESFPYRRILIDVIAATRAGMSELVLTGVDIAGYMQPPMFLSGLAEQLLADVPEIRRLRLSSLDPASPEIARLAELSEKNPRLLPHFHISMQSGSDTILSAMGRRHTAQMVRDLPKGMSYSWDLICGFPGETPQLFAETVALIQELKPIHIHAFPFSPRPGTPAATMPGQVDRAESKRRVKIVQDLADKNRLEFMQTQIGQTAQVLTEANNLARTEHDIEVIITDGIVPSRQVINVRLTGIDTENKRFTACQDS